MHVRSVLTCDSQDGVCGQCYGRDLARGTPVNIGEAVGVIAAQSIGEPGTQLTMRTFHIGGAAQASAEQSTVESPCDGMVRLSTRGWSRQRRTGRSSLGRNTELVVYDEVGREKLRQKLPNGTRLLPSPTRRSRRAQVLAEWDPHTLPVITEAAGTVVFQDMIDGTSFREVIDEATGKASKEVIDWRQSARSGNLRPSHHPPGRGRQPDHAALGQRGALLPAGRRASVGRERQKVEAGDILARLPRETTQDQRHHRRSAARGRALRGAQAQGPRDHRRDRGPDRVRQGLQEQAPLRSCRPTRICEPLEYLIPKGRHIVVQEGDWSSRAT